jgi:flagellar hook-length control protein FliK
MKGGNCVKVQNIIADTAGTLAKASSVNTVKSKSSTGFSDIMSSAGASSNSTAGSRSNTVSKTSKTAASSTAAKTSKTADSSNSSVQAKDVSNANSQNAVQKTDGKEISKETVQKVENEIKETVQEDLGISEEVLEEAMSALALSYLDLLNQDNIKALTMYVNGAADLSDVLMDDNISTMMTQVMADLGVETIAEKAEVPVPAVEQLAVQTAEQTEVPEDIAFSDVSSDVTAVTEEVPETLYEEILPAADETEVKQAVLEENPQEQTQVKEETASQTDLPEVSVVKDTDASDTKESLFDKGEQKSSGNQEELANNIVDHIAATTVTEQVSPDGTITMTTVEMRQVVVQIVQQIKIVINPEQTNMQMTLNPEHLGKLQLMLTSKNGIMTADFTVQNEMVKHALETQMQDLKDAFEEQGLKVEAVSVTVSTFEFTQSDQAGENGQQPEKKKQNRGLIDAEDILFDDAGTEEAEEKAAAAISGAGNNVNYTA